MNLTNVIPQAMVTTSNTVGVFEPRKLRTLNKKYYATPKTDNTQTVEVEGERRRSWLAFVPNDNHVSLIKDMLYEVR